MMTKLKIFPKNKKLNLRDGDGEIGSKQLGALPEAVERRDDGARENIFKNLQIHSKKKKKVAIKCVVLIIIIFLVLY
jgi:hypothetical protein